MDARGQLVQSAKDLRRAADKEKVSMAEMQHQLDKIKKNVQETHNKGLNAGASENLMYGMERQVKDMQKDIDNLERQAREVNKQANSF
jgi:predicted RNase H-like nuclease (RuvC/YqgF family)